jgi:hypothetical protein
MSLLRKMGVAALIVACCPWSVSQAGVYVGIGVPGPYYYPRPYYRPWYGGVYVAPPPVVVSAAPPVVVQQPAVVQQPVVVQPAYSTSSPPPASAAPPAQAPAPLPMPTPNTSVSNSPGAPDLMPTAAVGGGQADIDAALQQLRAGDEQARADGAVRLGRLRAEQAIGPIVRALNSDNSPIVREAAARSLGLIGSPTALSALQYAAQADNDREVRHSASFAAETIRGNLRR